MTSSFSGQHLAHGGQAYVEARETRAVSHELETTGLSISRCVTAKANSGRAVSRAASYHRKSKREVSCGRDGVRHARNWPLSRLVERALRQANDWWCRHYERDDTRYGAANPRRQAKPARHGRIPKDAIIDLVSARGTPDLLDSIKVGHVSGGVSVIGWITYGSTKSRPPTSSRKV